MTGYRFALILGVGCPLTLIGIAFVEAQQGQKTDRSKVHPCIIGPINVGKLFREEFKNHKDALPAAFWTDEKAFVDVDFYLIDREAQLGRASEDLKEMPRQFKRRVLALCTVNGRTQLRGGTKTIFMELESIEVKCPFPIRQSPTDSRIVGKGAGVLISYSITDGACRSIYAIEIAIRWNLDGTIYEIVSPRR